MKKRIISILAIICLLLTGCAAPSLPEVAADGTPWGEDWTNVGVILGVEPVEEWTEQRSEDLLADVGMYFASWTWGEGEMDTEGNKSYPAQVFLLLSGSDPEKLVAEWQTIAEETYLTQPARTMEHELGAFTLIPYRFADEDASFDNGMICLGIVDGYAFNLEFSCRDDVSLDPEWVLTAFLDRFHFAG